MKDEALDAFANKATRPPALEAAAAQSPDEGAEQVRDGSPSMKSPESLEASEVVPIKQGTPFGERTDGTGSAAKLVEDVVYGVKTAVDGALAWAEKKVDDLSTETESAGPYSSPALCAPSDLDVIASGVLPAIATQENPKNGEDG